MGAGACELAFSGEFGFVCWYLAPYSRSNFQHVEKHRFCAWCVYKSQQARKSGINAG